jgi:lysozyme
VNFEKLRKDVIKHEGVVKYAYQDHLGFWTIGVGRLIDERRGGGLSDDEVEYLLFNDLRRVQSALEERVDFWDDLSDTQQRALCNMAFQLGVNGILQFQKTLGLMREGKYKEASQEALNSRWAQQTPNRAAEVAAMLAKA